MTKSEWSGWVQALGAIVAIYFVGKNTLKAHRLEVAHTRAEAAEQREEAVRLVAKLLFDVASTAANMSSDKAGSFHQPHYDAFTAELETARLAVGWVDKSRMDAREIEAAMQVEILARQLVSKIKYVRSLPAQLDGRALIDIAKAAQMTAETYRDQLEQRSRVSRRTPPVA